MKNTGLIDSYKRFSTAKEKNLPRFMTDAELNKHLDSLGDSDMTKALDDPNFGDGWEVEF